MESLKTYSRSAATNLINMCVLSVASVLTACSARPSSVIVEPMPTSLRPNLESMSKYSRMAKALYDSSLMFPLIKTGKTAIVFILPDEALKNYRIVFYPRNSPLYTKTINFLKSYLYSGDISKSANYVSLSGKKWKVVLTEKGLPGIVNGVPVVDCLDTRPEPNSGHSDEICRIDHPLF